MVPWSSCLCTRKTVSTITTRIALIDSPTLDHTQVLDDVKIGGYHVLAGKGSTEFGIASATTELIRAVFHDEKKVLPCSCYLDGQYGEEGILHRPQQLLAKMVSKMYLN